MGWPPLNQISISEAVDQDIKPRAGVHSEAVGRA